MSRLWIGATIFTALAVWAWAGMAISVWKELV